jgi:glutathione S-transferase
VLGEFSYADITMAVILHFVRPVGPDFLGMGKASRRCWSDEELATEYADLLAWRDSLYTRHRRRGATA